MRESGLEMEEKRMTGKSDLLLLLMKNTGRCQCGLVHRNETQMVGDFPEKMS